MPAQPETPTPSPAATPPPSPLAAKVQKTLELSEDAGDTLEVPRDEEPRPTLGAATFEAPVPAPPQAKEAPWSFREAVREKATPPPAKRARRRFLAPLAAAAAAGALGALVASSPLVWEPLVDVVLPAPALVECRTDDAFEPCNVRMPPATCADEACSVLARPMRYGGQFAPLVVSPAKGANRTVAHLASFLDGHRAWARNRLEATGALLFRGYDVACARDFETISRALEQGELASAYQGTSPRKQPPGASAYVHTAADLPPSSMVPAHAEMSFVPDVDIIPKRLYFYAHYANAGPGGETPVTDLRSVLHAMDPAVLKRLRRPLRFERVYFDEHNALAKFLDPAKTKAWQQMFKTQDRDEARATARAQGYDATFLADGSCKLVHVLDSPTRFHPVDGAEVWHSHVTNLYANSWASEYARAAKHLQSPAYALRSLASHAYYGLGLGAAILKLAGSEVGMRVVYDDTGADVAARDMDYLRHLIFKFTSVHKHEHGDVVALDNFRVGHARLPWDGSRRELFAAWNA
jgi:hypothetical protein